MQIYNKRIAPPRRSRPELLNYRLIGHMPQISQFLLEESAIGDEGMLQIGRRLLDGSFDCIACDVHGCQSFPEDHHGNHG